MPIQTGPQVGCGAQSSRQHAGLISRLGRERHWREAISLFRRLPSKQIEPDVFSYNAAISALKQGQHWSPALQLWETAQEAGVDDSAVTCYLLISAWEQCCSWEGALTLSHELRRRSLQPDLGILMSVISAHRAQSTLQQLSWTCNSQFTQMNCKSTLASDNVFMPLYCVRTVLKKTS